MIINNTLEKRNPEKALALLSLAIIVQLFPNKIRIFTVIII